ncbi:hypothetical protein HJC23_011449 [Cyclotella cryptica]|uniref:Uncharacterized protein n=1 Tax=Cyclotella cryptica TaxID=29204 RepID=A0ABD3NJW7_9STRA
MILRILTTHIILSPIQYFKNLLLEIVSLMLHGLTHPLELPSVVWGVICLLMEDSRQLFHSLFRSVLVIGNENVSRREGRVMRNVESGDDSLPELENEDMCSSPKEEEDSRGKDDALIKQLEQQNPNKHIEHELKRYDLDELPPAFLSENDYPKGWLVHHPIHGVITREVSLDLKESG